MPSPPTPPRPRPSSEEDHSILYYLGGFCGEIIKAIRTPVHGPGVHVRTFVQESEVETPEGRVHVRRTTVDEVRKARD
ncbi:MAG: hypothetical protein U0637_08515 [Phycisphaerales bacterium]